MSKPVTLTVTVPAELVEEIARRVSELMQDTPPRTHGSPWLDLNGACAYLGLSRDAVYKLTAARAIPVRKKSNGQGLRFHRDELDQWVRETYPRLDRLD